MEKLKAMIRKMVQEEGFSRGSRKDKEAAKSRSTVLGMIQVEEEEAPSFDMSKTSDRGDGNYVSGNLKESTIKNIIKQAIIDEAKNWPLVEVGRTAGTETSQASPPKSSAEKQAVKLYGAYIEYKMNSGNSEYGYADQRNQLALKMLKDKFKVPSNLKSKLKDKKYHDKFTDYKSIVWEGKLTEMNEPWFEITYKDSRGRKKTDSMRAKNPKEAKKDFVNLMKGRGFKVLKVVKEGKLTEKKMDRRKAAEILKQIGGNRFIAMTGAKGFAFSDKYMSFKIGRNSKGINFVRIGHNAKDLYDMEFGFVSTRGIKVKKKVKDVYADMLGTIFTKHTGMYTSL